MKYLKVTIHYQSETKKKEVRHDDVLLGVIKTLFLSQDMTKEKFVSSFILEDNEGIVDPEKKVEDCRNLDLKLIRRDNDDKIKTVTYSLLTLPLKNPGSSSLNSPSLHIQKC